MYNIYLQSLGTNEKVWPIEWYTIPFYLLWTWSLSFKFVTTIPTRIFCCLLLNNHEALIIDREGMSTLLPTVCALKRSLGWNYSKCRQSQPWKGTFQLVNIPITEKVNISYGKKYIHHQSSTIHISLTARILIKWDRNIYFNNLGNAYLHKQNQAV